MEKIGFDVEHIARVRGGFSHSNPSLKRSTRTSPIPKTNSGSRVSSRPSDAGMRKRVKFSGSISICEPEVMRDGPLSENEGAHLSCFDGAKTFEYKSFKRLLEKTAQKHYFDEVAKSDIKPKEGQARNCTEASSNAVPSKCEVRRSSSPVPNVSFIVQGFLSSPTQVLQKQEFKNEAKGNNGAARSVPLSKIIPVDQLFHPSPQMAGKNYGGEHSGPMQEHKGTFSGKRACLLHLAAGTCLQNVNDFLSNRSDFIFEILQRLGIRRNANKHEKLQNTEQKMSAHPFPSSSKRSNHITEFCDNSQENSFAYKTEQCDNLLALKWDNTELQSFSYNHSFETSFECKHWKSNLFTEKGATILFDFDNPASAIQLSKEFDCDKYRYTDKTHTLLNSQCDISEVNVFPTDCATYTGQLYKNLHFNSALDHKGLFELSFTKDSDTSLNSKLELDCSSHGPHRTNHDSFQDVFFLPNSCNSENCFQEQALAPYMHPVVAKEQYTFPLLEWDATADQELPTPKCIFPKELDHFTKTLYDTVNFNDEIVSSSFFEVYGRRRFNFLTEL